MLSSIQRNKTVTYSEKYYSVLSTNMLSRHKKTWVKFKCILSKGHQSETIYMLYDFNYDDMSVWFHLLIATGQIFIINSNLP